MLIFWMLQSIIGACIVAEHEKPEQLSPQNSFASIPKKFKIDSIDLAVDFSFGISPSEFRKRERVLKQEERLLNRCQSFN